MKNARVFISCGQATDEEKEIGLRIQKYFEDRDFLPYFAQRVNSPSALTEHIFNAIKESEYSVVVNFERDNNEIGSLFVQQELAIIAFLKLPLVPFHKGNIALKGVAQYLILNSHSFNEVGEILTKLDELTTDWDANSKNQLKLSFDNHHYKISSRNEKWELQFMDGKPIIDDWYHITVHNLSSSINVKNCFGYIESIKKDGSIIFNDNYKLELAWAGVGMTNVNIPSKGKRDLDAFFYRHNMNFIFFNQPSTSSSYQYPPLSEGEHEIVYVIIADNIESAKLKVKFNFENKKIENLTTIQIF